jgi:hypothetical protein
MEASRNLESIPLLVPVRHRLSARDFQAEGLCEEMIEIARDTSGSDLLGGRRALCEMIGNLIGRGGSGAV